ncbi:MAG: LacI family DNA-binding transcriptional regulator [Streptosporangiales bacterium]|nr:LacI family DNA-binding transcriptional regulator [Streptosporangiales bacterium]
MPVTSHDVARLAGVSQPTVSRALRDQRGVSEATRHTVREAARALGYVPSQAGRALSTRSAGRVGIVSAELGNPFYPALIGPLSDGLAAAGYRTILVTDRGDAPVELEPLVDGSLDGVVLTTAERTSALPVELHRRGLPYVLVNRVVDGVDADSCVVDNRAGAASVADLLAELGHRHVGAVLGPDATSTGHEREWGFRDRLGDLGVALPGRLVRRVAFDADEGRRALTSLLAERPRPTAVFCGNDVIAFGVRNAARAAGVRIPADLTVVGFDDIPMASWEVFDLTTVRTDLAAMARHAVDLLVERMASPRRPDRRPARREVLTPELVRRGTHAPPP